MEFRDVTSGGSSGQLSSICSAGDGAAISVCVGSGGGMHHSVSTPAGVDGAARSTPPTTPKKGGKMLAIRVQMLDDSITIFQVQAKALGRVLFDQVCKQLHLLEVDYFGLDYQDISGIRYWLDLQKPISRQLGLSLVDPLLFFCVKFYTPDPGQLEEEYTRYLFCLQVKRDLAQGLMQCNDNTASLMASYIVQAECGDYVMEDYPDHTYLSSYKFVPHQDREMEQRIMENHKKHAGQSPAEADLNLLETARRCELYGVKMHSTKDHENVVLNLAVAHMGIVVFQQFTKINTFSWAKIRKISFKRKRFLIKLHPEGFGYYKDTVEFFFEGRNECKNFWKKCVENHGFFRCAAVKNISRHKTRVLSRGSSFRYSGKTQKQVVEFVRDNYVRRQTFQRSASFRHSSAHSSANNMHNTSSVGNSFSAHLMLPLADNKSCAEASKPSVPSDTGIASSAESDTRAPPPPVAEGALDSPTTRSVCRPPAIPTSWNAPVDRTDRISNTSQPIGTSYPTSAAHIPTMSSPSPPLTMQSVSPITSTTTSPQHPLPASLWTSHPAPVNLADDYAADLKDDSETTGTHRHYNSSPTSSNIRNNPPPLQTQSQYNLETTKPYAPVVTKRKIWQRSVSCRELYDCSFEDTGQAKRRITAVCSSLLTNSNVTNTDLHIKPAYVEELTLESPITRYDDRSVMYVSSRSSCLEIHQDIMMPDQKIFSNSYPGTCYPLESMEDPGNYDLRDSQEDISHDSYELIERSDDDYSFFGPDTKYQKNKVNMRSCSLDSGNYLPSDTESEVDRRHRCKSSSDVQCSIFNLEDPRDFPREIIPRKSDGTFYKSIRQSSRTSSLESKSDYYDSKTFKSSRDSLQKTRRKSADFNKHYVSESKRTEKLSYDSRSSIESKSDYYDADDAHKTICSSSLYDRHISFERNYGTQKSHFVPTTTIGETIRESHVHSVSLQNVETDQQIRSKRQTQFEQNTIPRRQKTGNQVVPTNTFNISKNLPDLFHENAPTIVEKDKKICHSTQTSEHSNQSIEQPDTEGNIFSFDNNQVRSYQDGTNLFLTDIDGTFGLVQMNKVEPKKNYRDVFIEIEPRKLNIINNEPTVLHQPIERTKSDPNSLARQRSTINSRRLLLKHQKSIDLTPAESSDEDYLYKQIPPSAPPIMRYRGTPFEIPTAEFGHFDVLKRETEGQKSLFEVPKRQFQELGAENQADLTNLVPSTDMNIPYTLHKRHIMNGTSKEEIISQISNDIDIQEVPMSPPDIDTNVECNSSFLFTQNIDLSKLNPVTLEMDETVKPIHHLNSPKRDITRIDPALLETLNSKLSQIESDSPTSSRTDSIKPLFKAMVIQATIEEMKQEEIKSQAKTPDSEKPLITTLIRDKVKDAKPKRIIKPRMQPGKKGKSNKSKVRITSFSSDDESLDSDDVFGSAEATPTKVEFSPPQMRKEMESILKYESERKYLQYTMSSTEIEGSPPTTRRSDSLYDRTLDPAYQTELRRISERSLSIPSSEDEFNIKVTDLQPVFEPDTADLTTVEELDREEFDKSIDDAVEQVTIQELMKEADLITITEQNELEKQLLNEDIERDIRDLLVPSRTKITEIPSPSMRRKGRSPLKFAHARLNLSEGSAFSLLQKQQAFESPLQHRRSQSLDAPIIPVYKLPPLNSISSKDDTVDEEDYTITNINRDSFATETEDEIVQAMSSFENKSFSRTSPANSEIEMKNIVAMETDQIVPDISEKNKKIAKKLDLSKLGQTKIAYNVKDLKTSPTRLSKTTKSADKAPKNEKSRSNLNQIPLTNLPTQSSLGLPEIKRTKSQEIESCNRPPPTEKAKSLEKLEFKRTSSRERTKSQDDSDTDIVKRKEKQQMLYEIAIKQSLKSPVKDTLPVFPQVEEMVRERHGKLEISINTIETDINLEDAIIITKSPKKLDKKMTKSLELNYNDEENSGNSVLRLGVSLEIDNQDDSKHNESTFNFEAKTIKRLTDSTGKISPNLSESFNQKNNEITDVKLEPVNTFETENTISSSKSCAETSVINDKDSIQLFEDVDPKDFQKAAKIVKKHVLQRLAQKRQLVDKELMPPTGDIPPKITSEEESLTEVSDLQDQNTNIPKKVETNIPYVRLKHNVEPTFSEDTGSWITLECDEFAGTLESLDLDNITDITQFVTISPTPNLTPKLSFEKANSSDGTTKASGSDVLTPQSSKDLPSSSSTLTSDKEENCEGNEVADGTGKLDLASRKYSPAKDPMDISPVTKEFLKSPRSPRICVLGRTFTIDEGMKMPIPYDGDSTGEDLNDQSEFNISDPYCASTVERDTMKYTRSAYPFEEKWSNNSELSQRLHKKLSKKLSSGDKCSMSSVEDSVSDQKKSCKNSFEKLINSFENVSTDSKNSIDTESSSGSLGMITRMQKNDDTLNKALSSTWKPFPLESSGSSSIEDGLPGLPPDHESNNQEYFLSKEDCEFTMLTDVHRADFSASGSRQICNDDKMRTFNQTLQGLGSEMMANTMFLSRTLSRISERSTNSEKSSIEDDSAKVSTQSSAHEETLSSGVPRSKSSESECKIQNLSSKKEIMEQYPAVNNLLQRQISDDRRTSAEMADLSIDDIEILTSERGLKLRRQESDDTIIEDDINYSQQNIEHRDSSSQDSEEWPLPAIPIQKQPYYDTPSTDTSQHTILTLVPNDPNIPKIFGLKGSLRSQDSEQWPSPPSSVIDPPIVGNVETQFVSKSEEASKVLVDSSTVSTYDNESNSFSDSDNKTLEDLEGDKTHTYENVAITEHNSESISESCSVGPSGVKIVVEKKNEHSESNSDDIFNGNDDVFDVVEPSNTTELRPATAMRHSTTSDESSISGNRGELKVPSPKHSHSSYSDEDQSSSLGTALENDTVRYALNRSKCTHSSHSEDTSIALSLSEWSNSTNTVKFQNLSTSKSATNSSGLKSDENSLTDIAHSISDRSTSNSTLKAQAQSIPFQKLSSSTGDSSTLTEMLPTLSEWSKVDEKPLGERYYYTSSIPERLFTRISTNIPEIRMPEPYLNSQTIPSEQDVSGTRQDNTYLKCTERPVLIPTTILSDNEKSTESSSIEQKTVHIFRNDKQKCFKNQTQSKSTDRSVKGPLKLSKCSPYYSSSLSSESTPMTASSIPPMSKTATVPLTRSHRKSVPKCIFPCRSPPSENDSTSSMESAKTKSESRDRRGHRRRRQNMQKRQKSDKDLRIDPETSQYNEYIRNRSLEELTHGYGVSTTSQLVYTENLEEGYYPDGDSQSGSDIFRMERDDDKVEKGESFDVSSIPPPLLEDDFELAKHNDN